MSWQGLSRRVARRSGISGTETFQPGTAILRIRATGQGGTVTMPKGDGLTTITLTLNADGLDDVSYEHALSLMGGPGEPAAQLALVFTGTASYFVEYRPPPQGE